MAYDFVVVGGGIVGVATAWQLQQRYPNKRTLLIEKEPALAQHQTGHNSGVIHAGVYYPPGSLKADFCKRGAAATKAFCEQEGIPYKQCGKLIVATTETELARMHDLYQRCLLNEIECECWDAQQLASAEPNVRGLGAIYVKATSVVDYAQVTEKMAGRFVAAGGHLVLNTQVTKLHEDHDGVVIDTQSQGESHRYHAEFLVVCAGLMADRMAKLQGLATSFQIIPYRGEYYQLAEKHRELVSHLIYPVPDPDLPFLGVHVTRMVDGGLTVGPNAVQGWKREGYATYNFSWRDTLDMLRFRGFWRVTAANLRTGIKEWWNAHYKPGYLKQVRKYCPSIQLDDLHPYPAGIRAQAVLNSGELVGDFLFVRSARSLHVCNAPSPAATSAMPIAEHICQTISTPPSE